MADPGLPQTTAIEILRDALDALPAGLGAMDAACEVLLFVQAAGYDITPQEVSTDE